MESYVSTNFSNMYLKNSEVSFLEFTLGRSVSILVCIYCRLYTNVLVFINDLTPFFKDKLLLFEKLSIGGNLNISLLLSDDASRNWKSFLDEFGLQQFHSLIVVINLLNSLQVHPGSYLILLQLLIVILSETGHWAAPIIGNFRFSWKNLVHFRFEYCKPCRILMTFETLVFVIFVEQEFFAIVWVFV